MRGHKIDLSRKEAPDLDMRWEGLNTGIDGKGGLELWAPNASLYENVVIVYLLSEKSFAKGSP